MGWDLREFKRIGASPTINKSTILLQHFQQPEASGMLSEPNKMNSAPVQGPDSVLHYVKPRATPQTLWAFLQIYTN